VSVPLFTLTPAIRQIYQDGIDTVIDQLGQPCKLVLDGVRAPCPNCPFDAAQGRSAGVYNGTGPYPFTRPPCPVCGGTGYDPATLWREEIRSFTIERDVKPPFVLDPGRVVRPGSLAKIKGFAADLPLVLQMRHVVLDYRNAVYLLEKYQLYHGAAPTPTGSIVRGRYFTALLEKVEG
jgi:hypothetical protein